MSDARWRDLLDLLWSIDLNRIGGDCRRQLAAQLI
jgi:hypothetical protein